MKKLLVGLAIGLMLLPNVSFAAVDGQQLNSLIMQLISLLQAQVEILQQQLVELQNQTAPSNTATPSQITDVTSQSIVQPTFGSSATSSITVPVTYTAPTVTKQLIIAGGGEIRDCKVNVAENFRYCQVEVYYLENGERKNTDRITVSADDAGTFNVNSYPYHYEHAGNPATMQTRPGPDGKPEAWFVYMPSATGTRKITATANGLTASSDALGQYVASQ